MKIQNSLDEFLYEVAQEELKKIEVPNLDDVWENIEKSIQEKKRKNKLHKRIAGVTAACVIFLCIGFMPSEKGYANYMRVLKFVTTIKDNVIEMSMDNRINENEYRKVKEKESNDLIFLQKNLTLSEIKMIKDFKVKEPEYLSGTYDFEKAIITKKGKKICAVELNYVSEDRQYIKIKEKPISQDHAGIVKLDSNGKENKQIIKNGFKYHIVKWNNGKILIIWDMYEVKYTLTGNLNEEEAMKIVLSIK